jgi:hypothetical protein
MTPDERPGPLGDEDWLREKYEDEGLSIARLAELAGATQTEARAALKRAGVETRSAGRPPEYPRLRDEDDTLVLYPDEWMDDGTVQLDRIETTDRAVEVSLSGPGDADRYEAVAAYNDAVADAVADAHGEPHADTARSFAAFMSNHYVRAVDDATPDVREEFREEYFPRNGWPSDEQLAVLDESLLHPVRAVAGLLDCLLHRTEAGGSGGSIQSHIPRPKQLSDHLMVDLKIVFVLKLPGDPGTSVFRVLVDHLVNEGLDRLVFLLQRLLFMLPVPPGGLGQLQRREHPVQPEFVPVATDNLYFLFSAEGGYSKKFLSSAISRSIFPSRSFCSRFSCLRSLIVWSLLKTSSALALKSLTQFRTVLGWMSYSRAISGRLRTDSSTSSTTRDFVDAE